MVLRFVVPKAAEAPIWNFSPTIPALSLHHPVKLEPVVGLGLLAHPSCSSRQLCRLRNLHQFALNSCDNTGSLKDFQPFVQRTFTVCPVDFQKNDFEPWCPFWCKSTGQTVNVL